MIDSGVISAAAGAVTALGASAFVFVGATKLKSYKKLKLEKKDIMEYLDIKNNRIEDHEKVFEKVKKTYKEENKEFMGCLSKFEKYLYSRPHVNKEIYNKNVSEVTIIFYPDEDVNDFLKNTNSGRFICNTDGGLIIKLVRDDYKKIIYHELLHLASNYIKDSIIYCGFDQYNTNTGYEVGKGVNEAFTEIINRTYFNKESKAYDETRTFVEKLVEIIGFETMEMLYFNADLNGLIDEMVKYGATKEEAHKFILNLDYINDYVYTNKFSANKYNIKAYIKSIDEINAFLAKLYANKMVKNDIDKDSKKLRKNIIDFIVKDNITNLTIKKDRELPLSVSGKVFKITTAEKVIKYADDAIDSVKHKDVA